MKKKVSLLIVAGILISGFFISKLLSNQKEPVTRKTVPAMAERTHLLTVETQTVTVPITLTGKLSSFNKLSVYAEVSGVLLPASDKFRSGAFYQKGEVLLQMDDTVQRNNLLSQKSSFLNQLTQLIPDIKIDIPERAEVWEDFLESFTIEGDVPTLPEPASEKERYYIASRSIYTQYYSIKSLEATWEKYTLRAPFDGIVTESFVTPGTLVRNGQQLGEFTNTDIYEMEAFAGISDVYYLKSGLSVTLTCSDIPGEFDGHISRINTKIDDNSQTIKVYIQTRDSRLHDGLFMKAEINSVNIDNVVSIPSQMMTRSGQVWVNRNSTAHLQSVTVVGNQDDNYFVTGLSNGDQIITNPGTEIYEGKQLTTQKQKSARATAQSGKVQAS